MTPERLQGIDCGRAIAVLAVVFGHAQVQVPYTTAYDIMARFAVPFFFLLAGYFFKLPDGPFVPVLGRMVARFMVPFFIWLAIYMLWFEPSLAEWSSPMFLAKLLIQGGPAHHLWFLPSLTISSALFLLLLWCRVNPAVIAAIAVALYAIGLAFGPYYDLITGGGRFFWNMRNGPFYGFPFMVAGWLIARMPRRPGLGVSLMVLLAGIVFHAGEILALDRFGLRFEHDLLIGTVPFGIGFFLVALRIPATALGRLVARIGPYSLGIYCIHLLIILVADAMFGDPWAMRNPYMVGLFAATVSLAICYALSHVPHLAPLVRTPSRRRAREPAPLLPAAG